MYQQFRRLLIFESFICRMRSGPVVFIKHSVMPVRKKGNSIHYSKNIYGTSDTGIETPRVGVWENEPIEQVFPRYFTFTKLL